MFSSPSEVFSDFYPNRKYSNTLWILRFAHILLKIVEQFSSKGIIYAIIQKLSECSVKSFCEKISKFRDFWLSFQN